VAFVQRKRGIINRTGVSLVLLNAFILNLCYSIFSGEHRDKGLKREEYLVLDGGHFIAVVFKRGHLKFFGQRVNFRDIV
jgi:hypothetical protein